MKKFTPYLLIGLVILAVILLATLGAGKSRRKLNERVTLQQRDKIPYGTFVAYRNLSQLFPKADVFISRDEPAEWDSLSFVDDKQALIIVCPEFNATSYEMKNLIKFAENGNDVFVSAMNLSWDVTRLLDCSIQTTREMFFFSSFNEDTLTVSLANPPYDSLYSYTYPGKQYDGYFSKIDTNYATVVGYDSKRRADFVRFKAGKGNLYVHLAPMAFTNYFLLHKDNFPYYEKAFSLISPDTKKIAWDEYFANKPRPESEQPKQKNWLAALLGLKNPDDKPVFLYAFWVLLSLLVLYVLMEMRRKQRHIPVVKKPTNDSLDFVKTIGRLYHDKGDHHNLARKMAAYFLEYVRNRYKLPTSTLNEEFVTNLQSKSGVREEELRPIVDFIGYLEGSVFINAKQLATFHKQLESFYKKA